MLTKTKNSCKKYYFVFKNETNVCAYGPREATTKLWKKNPCNNFRDNRWIKLLKKSPVAHDCCSQQFKDNGKLASRKRRFPANTLYQWAHTYRLTGRWWMALYCCSVWVYLPQKLPKPSLSVYVTVKSLKTSFIDNVYPYWLHLTCGNISALQFGYLVTRGHCREKQNTKGTQQSGQNKWNKGLPAYVAG